MMRTYLKRQGIEDEDKIVFIINSRDTYVKRAALQRGWLENPISNSVFFDLKWDYNDNPSEYSNLKPSQFYNHFPDGRELTTKQGLNKNINSITSHCIDVYQFYPRCYDLSDVRQIDSFIEDFNRTGVLSVIKKHARMFKGKYGDKIKEALEEDRKIIENMYNYENKKKLKKKFSAITNDETLGWININLLTCAIFYAKNLLNDILEKCEGDEFFKRDFYVPRFEI